MRNPEHYFFKGRSLTWLLCVLLYIAVGQLNATPFGDNQPVGPGELGNLVWNDLDGDGIQDAGEPGLPGVVVELYRDNGDGVAAFGADTYVGFQTTNSAGAFCLLHSQLVIIICI